MNNAGHDSMGDLIGSYTLSLNAQLRVFEEGFVVSRRLGRDLANRYSQVGEIAVALGLRIRHEAEVGSVVTQSTWTVRLLAGAQEPITLNLVAPPVRTLARDFFRYGIRRDVRQSLTSTLVEHITDRVALAQLPRALATVSAGGAVDFGVITVTPDGLVHVEAGLLPWREFVEMDVMNYYDTQPPKAHGGTVALTVRNSADGRVSRIHVPSDRIVNLATLQRLCAELGPAASGGPDEAG